MSKEAAKGGAFGRLWSGREEPPAAAPAQQWPADEKVVPLVNSDRTYIPFDIREHINRMHIHCATQPSHNPNYHHLLDIVFDHAFQGVFTLVYSFIIIEVTGRNLGPIVHAISYEHCACIREYHKKLYDPPTGETVIESITVLAAQHPHKAPVSATS